MGMFDLFPRRQPNIIDMIGFVGTVLSDPETDGKKDGYVRAAKEYEPIYQGLKKEYDSAILEIQRQKQNFDIESDAQIGYLAQLEKKRDSLQEQFNYKVKQTSSKHGIPVPSLMGSLSNACVVRDTSWDMMRLITDSKLRKRKEAEKAGYSEAKKLYEGKLKSLRDKLEQEKVNGNKKLKDYSELITKVLNEIEDTQMKIADLEIVLQEG